MTLYDRFRGLEQTWIAAFIFPLLTAQIALKALNAETRRPGAGKTREGKPGDRRDILVTSEPEPRTRGQPARPPFPLPSNTLSSPPPKNNPQPPHSKRKKLLPNLHTISPASAQ
jgi:hypothetical protein